VDCDAPVEVDDRPLTPAVNAVLEAADEPVAVVMADLPLATGPALDRVFAPDGDVVVAPGRGGGTNALRIDHPDFRVDYHGVSVRDHRREARNCGASVREVDSFRLAVDVDEPANLLEVLLHGEGRTVTWVREAGFTLEVGEGGPTITRSAD
jgi:2-phospho-L-lactate guanylyltransferase